MPNPRATGAKADTGDDKIVLTMKATKQGLFILLTEESLQWFVDAIHEELKVGDLDIHARPIEAEVADEGAPQYARNLCTAALFTTDEIDELGENIRYWQSKQILRATYSKSGAKPITRSFTIRPKRRLSQADGEESCKRQWMRAKRAALEVAEYYCATGSEPITAAAAGEEPDNESGSDRGYN